MQGGSFHSGVLNGDGIMRLGGPSVRLQVLSTDGNGDAASTVSLVTAGGVVMPSTMYYQAWYRDHGSSPCNTYSNWSSALAVTWIP